MLTGLKVSSLACKCVFNRPKHNAERENPMEVNFEGLLNFEVQKVNVTTDQLVAEKNGVICLVIMFTLRVMVMKMSKMFQFLYFLLMAAKN